MAWSACGFRYRTHGGDNIGRGPPGVGGEVGTVLSHTPLLLLAPHTLQEATQEPSGLGLDRRSGVEEVVLRSGACIPPENMGSNLDNFLGPKCFYKCFYP